MQRLLEEWPTYFMVSRICQEKRRFMQIILDSNYGSKYLIPTNNAHDLATVLQFLELAVRVKRVGYDSPAKYELHAEDDGTPSVLPILIENDTCLTPPTEESWRLKFEASEKEKNTNWSAKYAAETKVADLEKKLATIEESMKNCGAAEITLEAAA